MALPYEALDAEHRPRPLSATGPAACARQLYLFASLIGQVPAAEERGKAPCSAFAAVFSRRRAWRLKFYSIDLHGAPLDQRKDLYTHAFILFACAHYWDKVREPLVESVLNAALEVIARRFASTGDGLYEASPDRNWLSLGSGPLQNLVDASGGSLSRHALGTRRPRRATGTPRSYAQPCRSASSTRNMR